tara:strand:- start:80 stop:226 length:147 start_codon:yes stop_codon:yes gene_type:complete
MPGAFLVVGFGVVLRLDQENVQARCRWYVGLDLLALGAMLLLELIEYS